MTELKPHCVLLSHNDVLLLKNAGNGNLSDGIRIKANLKQYKRGRPKKPQKPQETKPNNAF